MHSCVCMFVCMCVIEMGLVYAFIVVYIGHMVKSTVKDPLHAFAFWVYGARSHIFNQCLFSVIITHSLPRWAYAGKFIFSGPSSTGWITCLYHAQQP